MAFSDGLTMTLKDLKVYNVENDSVFCLSLYIDYIYLFLKYQEEFIQQIIIYYLSCYDKI